MAIAAAALHHFQSPQMHSAALAIHNTGLPGCSQESVSAATQGLHPILPPASHAHKSPSLQHLHLDSPKPYTQTAVPPLQHHSAARSLLVDPNTWVFGAHLHACSTLVTGITAIGAPPGQGSRLAPHTCKPTTLRTHCNLQHSIWPSTSAASAGLSVLPRNALCQENLNYMPSTTQMLVGAVCHLHTVMWGGADPC